MLTMLAEDKKASLPLDVELPCFNAAYIFTSFFEEVYLSISFNIGMWEDESNWSRDYIISIFIHINFKTNHCFNFYYSKFQTIKLKYHPSQYFY